MEAQGCTSLVCICKELFGMHAWKKGPHELPIWKEDLALNKLVNSISDRLARQTLYSSIDWIDGYIAKIEIHRGKMQIIKKNCFKNTCSSLKHKEWTFTHSSTFIIRIKNPCTSV